VNSKTPACVPGGEAQSRSPLLPCGALLLGLLANLALGWWWADPTAALVIAAVAVKEGRDAWRGDTCCPAPTFTAAAASAGTPVDDREPACVPGCDCCT